jgi:uncharacterized protein
MKQNLSDQPAHAGQKLLILSDEKPGHVNQSIAFARHLGFDYDLIQVPFKAKWLKGLSYLADRAGVYSSCLFKSELDRSDYSAVVSAGSGTYYANRVLSAKLKCKSVAIMLPQGYRLDFDLIVAQKHDDPLSCDNLICLPINLTFVDPQGLIVPDKGHRYVSIIVGGDSKHSPLDHALLRTQIVSIMTQFPNHEFWLTTSRRTSKALEEMLREFSWSRAIYYSQEPINPIPDFLEHSDYVFITSDSSSMISEAVSYGSSCVEILSMTSLSSNSDKFSRFLNGLIELKCLHLYDGQLGQCSTKISLEDAFNGVYL